VSAWPLAKSRVAQIALVFVLLLAWFCYQPAISGAFQLDDRSNLQELSRVSDFDSGVSFALSGSAGPIGRPIALATFAMQASHWDDGAAAFLQANIFIHLLNAILLAYCVYRLSLCLSMQPDRAMINAALVAGIWVLMPLLATATMLVVQRMATLSATFMLMGLAGYLLARSRLNESPQRAMLWMSISLVAGTLFAILSKESGLLLPVFVLVLEVTVLQPPASLASKVWRMWQALFLGVPLLFIITYLATTIPYPETLALGRGFTGGERLMTEAQLLWVYLFKAIVGSPDTLGIFQDPPTVAHSIFHGKTLLACVSWAAMIVGAIVWRRRVPLISLAVLWFVAGHLIESTFVALELYFEHRNYLPVIGPLFALSTFVLTQERSKRLLGISILTTMLAVNAYFLYVFASLWGDPSTASRYWAIRYPDSIRAVTAMATYQLSEEGPMRAVATLDSFASRNPQHAYLRIQQLNLLCRVAGSADHSQLVRQMRDELPSVGFTYSAGTMLSQLFDAVTATKCSGLDSNVVIGLAESLRNNPRYIAEPHYNQFHQKLMAAIARSEGDHDASIEHLRAAIALRPSAELNFMMVTALVNIGQFDAARKFMDDARLAAPSNPFRAAKWNRDLDELVIYVDEVEKVKQ
jgi:tetratricopeptide (TPR) repeat protein